MKGYEMIIGIDPDTDRNGFATFDRESSILLLNQYDLTDTFSQLLNLKEYRKIFVRLESGHTLKSTWHKGGNGMAKRVGANHEIGRQIEKFLIKNEIPHELVKPFGGSNMDHQTFCRMTGWDIKKRTNPETRVAGLLSFKPK